MTDECSQFRGGSRKWSLCTGHAPVPEKTINAYRARWGLPPLTTFPDVERSPVVRTGSQERQRMDRVRIPAGKRNTSCKCEVRRGGPGTELKTLMSKRGVPACQACIDLAAKMDVWGVGGCRERVSEVVEDIFPRAKLWFEKEKPWVHALLPEVIEDVGIRMTLKQLVNEAIDLADSKEVRKNVLQISSDRRYQASPAVFASGDPIFQIRTVIRTAPRQNRTLDKTVDSMLSSGFELPLVYNDEQSDGPFRSFLMVQQLLASYTGWILLCEDDVLFRSGTADFLRQQNLTPNQVISLYCSTDQEVLLTGDGFTRIVGDMHGSLAYFIHSSALQKVVNSQVFKQWSMRDRVDRAFCSACREQKIEILVHKPSIAQHIGDTSTLYSSRKLTSKRTATWDPSPIQELPKVTIITPTGDRPLQFSRCEKWVRHQRYTGPIQWIVIDDGHVPTQVSHAHMLIREEPMNGHSLCRNLRSSIPHIQGDVILIFEDDDYYGPDFVSSMVGRLAHADLAGEFGAKYYYIRERKYRHNLNESHASLCRTGFTRNVLPLFERCVTGTDHPSVDLRLWSQWDGAAISWRDESGTSRMCVGIKGGPGRQSHGHKASPTALPDPDLRTFQQWLGPSWEEYQCE